ncbi:MAG: glycyl-radical enzyme activating protein [Spirochaetales bacterium]|jgi:pyruvate formate lyase activating enzyme|nr:glycyl-radical enzyme activating protein [Spirochaetales bacterium]
MVFNIQRYCIHDGPGIRTIVFLKGCPLRCLWCSNPEGMDFLPEISYNKNICRKCGVCVSACPRGALSFAQARGIEIARDRCDFCGACAGVCPADALKIFGRSMSVTEILDTAAKDAAFYRRSGGGLTLSGGEPLAAENFTLALLKAAKEDYALDTAMETSFCAPEQTVDRIAPWVDHLMVDIKLMDPLRHRQAAGADNAVILRNIRRVAAERPAEKSFTIRFPLIPGLNDDERNFEEMARFITGLDRAVAFEVLPYHEFGRGKYANAGRAYPLAEKNIPPPGKEAVDAAEEYFRQKGVQVVHT